MKQICSRNSFIIGGIPLSSLAVLVLLWMILTSSPSRAAAFAGPEQATGPAVAIAHTVGLSPTDCPAASQITVAKGTDLYFCLMLKNTGDFPLTSFIITRVLEFPNKTNHEEYQLRFPLGPGEQISLTNESLLAIFKLEDSFELLKTPAGADVTVALTANTTSASVMDTSNAKVDVVDISMERHVGTTAQNCHEKSELTVPAKISVYHCYEVTNSGSITITVDRIEDALLDSIPVLNLQIGPNETIMHGALAGSIGDVVTIARANSVHTATAYAAAAGFTVSATAHSTISALGEFLYVPVLQTPSAFVGQRALWEAQAITSYEMIQRVGCFCPPPHHVQLTVEDGQIVSGVDFDTREPIPSNQLTLFRSVDELFELIDRAEALPAATLNVNFEQTKGYPTVVSIDYILEVADDEISYSVTYLEPIAGR